MTKTSALFLDSYRELNAKRLFWITLAINVLMVAALAMIGIREGTITLLVWKTPWTLYWTPARLYKWLFTNIVVPYWLTWAASILGLVTTTGIFPDFIASGSIDLYLSKPISRLSLFLTKYLGGLLFMAFQATVFAFGTFMVIGIRAGEWEPRILLTIPLVLLVFSFVFCFCVLLGTATRSAIASLLVTLLIWLMLCGIQTTESVTLTFLVHRDLQIEQLETELNPKTAAATRHSTTSKLPFGLGSESKSKLQAALNQLHAQTTLEHFHSVILALDTIIPKTQTASDLLGKIIPDEDAVADPFPVPPNFPHDQDFGMMSPYQQQYIGWRASKIQSGRGPSWWLGTSIASELFIMALAAWIFCRRDY